MADHSLGIRPTMDLCGWQYRGLGMAVQVFNDAGQPLRDEKGELVCTRPFP